MCKYHLDSMKAHNILNVRIEPYTGVSHFTSARCQSTFDGKFLEDSWCYPCYCSESTTFFLIDKCLSISDSRPLPLPISFAISTFREMKHSVLKTEIYYEVLHKRQLLLIHGPLPSKVSGIFFRNKVELIIVNLLRSSNDVCRQL